ncbi:unnamed protein product [Adineta ricciae]|uniref:Reverse transcriptase n=1 Tax=Adineta ricciae TaxID=249248 RepID=A0A816EIX7_ADIRI|nr:unnamed protein product [Adineta ricciae]CAF1649835.1 unnamed protein product [Adineta ricciae]
MPAKMILHDTGKKDKEEPPNLNNIRGYWQKIVGVSKPFNSTDRDLVAWKQSLTLQPEEDDLKKRLSRELWDAVVRKAKPWKAHGPDGLQGFWWKAFKSACGVLYQLARYHLTTGKPLPIGWLTDGRIVLIYKAGSTNDPANYRPIACLNTCYKMLTGFITAYLNIYVKERHVLPEEQIALRFPTIDGGSLYKYLGMEQAIGIGESEAWKRVEERCCKTARQIWNSDLTFRQKVNAYNTTLIPALTYVVGNIIKGKGTYASVLKRGNKFDIKVRKILVELKSRYKAGCVERLYLSTELGGCGLKSVKDSIMEATIYSWAYLCTKSELRNSLGLFADMYIRKKRSVISDAEKVMVKHGIVATLEPTLSIVNINGVRHSDGRTLARYVVESIRAGNNISRRGSWGAKVLAWRVLHEAKIDGSTSFTWLKDGKLSSIAVRNVSAAQEGCLITRTHPSCKSQGNLRCRACGNPRETIEHVTTSCSKWLPTLYIDRHDSVGRSLHYRICEKYDLAPPHYSQRVESVMENESIKLYWDQPVQTKKLIKHNKPDIVLFDKSGKTVTILEVAVSWFTGIGKQIEIKTNRYCVNGNWEDKLNPPYPPGDNLQRELEIAGWRVTFLPVVIGACGEVVPGLRDQLSQVLGIDNKKAEDCIERMQRSACLGTSRIIKNHLAKTA